MHLPELLLEASSRSRKGEPLMLFTRDPALLRKVGTDVVVFNAVRGTVVWRGVDRAIVSVRPQDVLMALASCARLQVAL